MSGGRTASIGRVTGLAVMVLLLLLPPPADMPLVAWHAAAVGVLMAIWWVTEAIPISATALVPLVLFPPLHIAPIGDAASPYANPIIFLFLGGFMIAAALARCGLHRRMALTIIARVGTEPARLVGGFMLATAALSLWVSNTATVVMLLPMAEAVIELVEQGGGADGGDPGFATALLLGLAYAASIGGMGTLIGTPPNALLAGFLQQSYGIHIGFARWMLLGIPLVAVGLPLCWLLLTRVLFRFRLAEIPGGATFVRRQLADLGRPSRAEITAGLITAATALAWVTSPLLEKVVPGISDAGIALAGALLLFLVPVAPGRASLMWKDVRGIPWGVLLLFGGGLSLAAAIQQTGLATWLGHAMAGTSGWPVPLVVAAVTALVVFLTELTSNTATAAAFLPVVGSLAIALGEPPLTLAIPAALAASCAFMLPVATPPNALVYGSERLTIPQMARAGFFLNLLFIALITVAALFLVPVVLSR